MRYVDEQAYRFNERGQNDGERFVKLLASGGGKRLTWDRLTSSYEDYYGWAFQFC